MASHRDGGSGCRARAALCAADDKPEPPRSARPPMTIRNTGCPPRSARRPLGVGATSDGRGWRAPENAGIDCLGSVAGHGIAPAHLEPTKSPRHREAARNWRCDYFRFLRSGPVRPPLPSRRTGRGGRFLASSLKRKRPANTQPFMPGSQGRPATCWQVPSSSCGQPQPLIKSSSRSRLKPEKTTVTGSREPFAGR